MSTRRASGGRRGFLGQLLIGAAVRKPAAVFAVWFCVLAASAPGLFGLRVETSTESILNKSDEAWGRYQESQDRFGGDEIVTVLVSSQEPLDPAAFLEVEALTARFEGVPGVRRVDSLATVPLVHASPDGSLSLEPATATNLSGDQLSRLLDSDRISQGALISEDRKHYAVNLVLDRSPEGSYSDVMRALDEAPGEWPSSGVPHFRLESDRRMRSEVMIFAPVAVLLVSLVLFGVFRSWVAVAAPLSCAFAGTWACLGLMGSFGVPVGITTVILPSVLLAIGCAYAMHALCAAAGRSHASLEESLSGLGLPLSVSIVSTAAGFLALAVVEIQAVQFVGAFGAIGVVLVGLASLTLGPAILKASNGSSKLRPFASSSSAHLAEYVRWVGDYKWPIMGLWAVAAVLGLVGLRHVTIETDVIEWLHESDSLRVDYNEIRGRISGISPMNVVIETGRESPVTSAETLSAIDGLSAHLGSLPEVGKAISIADPLRQLLGGLRDDPSQPLPSSEAESEQLLLILESKSYMRSLVAADRSAANLLLRVNDNSSSSLLAVAAEAEEWWEANGPPGTSAHATGIMFEFARAEDAIAYGQLWGLALASLVVLAILLAAFGQLRLAVVAVVPNLVPLAVLFGVMGLLGVPLDAGTVTIGCIALGIAVDDTCHLVARFRASELSPGGCGRVWALRDALGVVWRPLVLTTATVTFGFLVLTFSGFAPVRNLGVLTSAVMMLLLAADLTLLPALILGFRSAGAVGLR